VALDDARLRVVPGLPPSVRDRARIALEELGAAVESGLAANIREAVQVVQGALTTDDDDAELDAIRLVLGQAREMSSGHSTNERTPQ